MNLIGLVDDASNLCQKYYKKKEWWKLGQLYKICTNAWASATEADLENYAQTMSERAQQNLTATDLAKCEAQFASKVAQGQAYDVYLNSAKKIRAQCQQTLARKGVAHAER